MPGTVDRCRTPPQPPSGLQGRVSPAQAPAGRDVATSWPSGLDNLFQERRQVGLDWGDPHTCFQASVPPLVSRGPRHAGAAGGGWGKQGVSPSTEIFLSSPGLRAAHRTGPAGQWEDEDRLDRCSPEQSGLLGQKRPRGGHVLLWAPAVTLLELTDGTWPSREAWPGRGASPLCGRLPTCEIRTLVW